jgi:imidazolonepropionase-like amidohydrolase
VWTSAAAGILDSTDVVLRDGKIAAVGKGLTADTTIDCTGMQITPGIIDEHSHIAISRGVNEGTHAVTTEVRIGDVVYPDDVNIYRQLSGGVTSTHLLHGSANPMGGQLQYIKTRWGADAEELKVEGAVPTVKFALGENVKQANWGDRYTVRYPQSRMGVEEIMRDAFRTAREYEREMRAGDPTKPVRRDLQLDALVEIVSGKRNIHCHSYVQSEILMLMRLAEEFGFRVHTFTHILEGYKVAKEMAKHGARASSFADWWAYKFEVYDAIPESPAIMHEQGVTVSINSDDAEMARRLNQEAAKSIKYGGVSEEDAMKFVTINAAKQMAIDQRLGSIEVGKDADVVVWSGNPLSNMTRVERTFVDGCQYFARDVDQTLRKRDAELRAFLEQEAITAIGQGASSTPGGRGPRREYHCDTQDDEVAGSGSNR